MTESEWKAWKAKMNRINSAPATMELKRSIEEACWRYLTHVSQHGVDAALEVAIKPLNADVSQSSTRQRSLQNRRVSRVSLDCSRTRSTA